MFSNRVIVHSTLPLISSSRGKGSLSKSTTPDGGRSARISCGCRWSALNWTEPLNWCRCVCLWRENLLKNCQPSQKKKKKTLVLLTQCLAEKIFARQHSGTQHWGLSECEPSTLFPLLRGIHTATTFLPPPPHPLTHTLHTHIHTGMRHAWLHVCTFAHTHSKVSEMSSAPPDEKTPRTQTPVAYVGRGPFIRRDNVCVDFSLSAHF